MRAIWLAPHNIHLEVTIESLKELDLCSLIVVWYEAYRDIDSAVLDVVGQIEPDLVIYTGQNSHIKVGTEAICRIKQICPVVAMIHDGSDSSWAPLLHEYRERDACSCVVNIDGNNEWEHGPNDITALTPIPTRFYE